MRVRWLLLVSLCAIAAAGLGPAAAAATPQALCIGHHPRIGCGHKQPRGTSLAIGPKRVSRSWAKNGRHIGGCCHGYATPRDRAMPRHPEQATARIAQHDARAWPGREHVTICADLGPVSDMPGDGFRIQSAGRDRVLPELAARDRSVAELLAADTASRQTE